MELTWKVSPQGASLCCTNTCPLCPTCRGEIQPCSSPASATEPLTKLHEAPRLEACQEGVPRRRSSRPIHGQVGDQHVHQDNGATGRTTHSFSLSILPDWPPPPRLKTQWTHINVPDIRKVHVRSQTHVLLWSPNQPEDYFFWRKAPGSVWASAQAQCTCIEVVYLIFCWRHYY